MKRRTVIAGLLAAAAPIRIRAKGISSGFETALDESFGEHAPPALAGAIITRAGVHWSGVRGVRRFGTPDRAQIRDKWHLGSCTKAVTGALYGRLVEQGVFRWDAPLPTLLPGFAIDASWRDVTLEQFLMHRAGVSDGPFLTEEWITSAYLSTDNLVRQRRQLVEALLGKPRMRQFGVLEYSNLDYILAGSVIEQATGKAWEAVMRAEVFEPLGIKTGGFGAARGRQPWSHTIRDGKPVAVSPDDPRSDNPPVVGPAGTVHMSIGDHARFIRVFLTDGGGWLRPETVRKLTTPFDNAEQSYALGWVVVNGRSWARGPMLGHEGTNTKNHAYVAVAPHRGVAVAAYSNDEKRGAPATQDLARALIGHLDQSAIL